MAVGETFAEGVIRLFRMAMGIAVQVLEDLHGFYAIREPGEPLIPGIRFLCTQVGEAAPRSTNHTDVRWVSEKDFREMSAGAFIPGLKQEVLDLIERYKRRR